LEHSESSPKGETSSDASRDGTIHRVLGGLDSVILKAWRFFKSLKMGILLLVIIGAVCVWGTMGFASNAALGNNQIPMARKMVFQSPWFAGLLTLFAVQLVISTWHVTLMSFTIWRKKEFRRSASFYEPGSSSPRGVIEGTEEIDKVLPFLRKRFTYAHEEGGAYFAQRGLLSRLGPTVIHFGMIVVLASGLVRFFLVKSGHIVSEGRFIAAEGEYSNAIWEPIDESQMIGGRNTRAREIPGGLYIRVLDFDEDQHANIGSPKYFSSLIEITDPSTSQVTVRQLDMNHSTALNGLQFHQAGYEAVEDTAPVRFNFDIRRISTGERIAVTDTSAAVPVRIGDTDYHVILTGTEPGARWEIFHREDPTTSFANGIVQGGAGTGSMEFAIVEFFPNFRIDPDTKLPINFSNDPDNPAAQLVTYINGEPHTTEWVFLSAELAAEVPTRNSAYRFSLVDVQVPAGAQDVQWQEPGAVRFVVEARRLDGKGEPQILPVFLKERSRSLSYDIPAPDAAAPTGTEKDFQVINIGPTQRYLTVLSVIREPTVAYTTLGVIIILLGAGMTFANRYEAFYALRDTTSGTLRVALVPRWGHGSLTARESLARILRECEAELSCRGTLLASDPNASKAAASEPTISDPQALTTP